MSLEQDYNQDELVVFFTPYFSVNEHLEGAVFELYKSANHYYLQDWISKLECDIHNTDNSPEYVEIVSFITWNKQRDKGYGSLLLREFLKCMEDVTKKSKGNITIFGELRKIDEVDENNHQRRDHVYQKFGFELDYRTRKLARIVTKEIK
ncbi:hypothetical protein [Pseudolactococcus yaeyamensis]